MKQLFFALLAGCVVFGGCSKRQNSAPTSETSALTAQPEASANASAPPDAPAPAAPPPPPAAAPDSSVQPVSGVVDPALTAQLHVFIQEKGRLPTSFAELAAARLDSVPRLQKGLSFAIDPTTQQVKIVRQ